MPPILTPPHSNPSRSGMLKNIYNFSPRPQHQSQQQPQPQQPQQQQQQNHQQQQLLLQQQQQQQQHQMLSASSHNSTTYPSFLMSNSFSCHFNRYNSSQMVSDATAAAVAAVAASTGASYSNSMAAQFSNSNNSHSANNPRQVWIDIFFSKIRRENSGLCLAGKFFNSRITFRSKCCNISPTKS